MAKSRRTQRKSARTAREEPKPIISTQMLVIVGVAALLIVGGLVWLGTATSQPPNLNIDTSRVPALGDPEAPVVMEDFSDYG